MTPRGVRRIRAVLVEDDAVQRRQVASVLQEEGDITVAPAASAEEATALVADERPDVVILDLHLPNGAGQRAIEHIMAHTPTPILVLSARIQDRSSPSAVEALVAGALDALPRPARWTARQGAELRQAVREVEKVQVIRHHRGSRSTRGARPSDGSASPRPVVAVAASTGGPSALATLLPGLAGLEAPVLVVQHLHPDFITGLVDWMSRVSAIPVGTAVHGQVAAPGRAYFAPGQRHLRYTAEGRLQLASSPAAAHTPSADELFGSVATAAGPAGIGVLLTGMGDDGARGLLAMRQRGGTTFAQDEASCTVFGMPRAADRLGAVSEMLPIEKIADAIQRAVREVRRR